MRILLKLEALGDYDQKITYEKYPIAFRSIIFNALKKKHPNLHDKKEFKPFTFSNIFPISNRIIQRSNEYNIIISGLPEIIEELFFYLKINSILSLGEMQFRIKNIELFTMKIKHNQIIENITPINITVHKNNKIIPITIVSNKELFIRQLKNNLKRKYEFFFKKKIEFDPFENIIVLPYNKKPTVACPIWFSNSKKFIVIGSKISLKIGKISDAQKEFFEKVVDLGFGERTSYGFGFMVWKR